MELRGIDNDFYKRKLKSAIRKVIVSIVDEYDNQRFAPSTSSTPMPSPLFYSSPDDPRRYPESCADLLKTFTDL